MAEKNKGKQVFTVSRIFFLLIVIPLSLMAILIANGIFRLGVTAKERTVTVLDQQSQEEIKARAIVTAEEIASFLMERKKDLLVATIIPATDTAFRQFVQENRKPLWVRQEGKVRQVLALLYPEMSLTDREGNERIKIIDGETVPKTKLGNVSKPEGTTFRSERFFSLARGLNRGEVYLSHVTGWSVNRADFEQGKRFGGIIRLATPIFDRGGFAGVLSLALDYRHLAGFTDHIIPTQAGYFFEAETTTPTGNYAYLVDNRGYVISHPFDYYIPGLREDGTPVAPLTEKRQPGQPLPGDAPLNLNFLGYMDPILPEIARDAAGGSAGVKVYKSGNHTKFVAYAPVPFYSRDYPEPAGFGWVGMALDVDRYNQRALQTSQNIDREAKSWTSTIIVILILSVILLCLIMALLSRGITRSLEAEVSAEAQEAGRRYDDEEES